MKVAITGGSGHVGGNLARALIAEGHEVRALAREDRRALDGLDVTIVAGDVLEPDSLARAFEGAEVVYHAAARISLKRDDPVAERINVEGTRNIVEACLAAGVRRLVHFSSIHACSPNPPDKPIDEARALNDDSPLAYDRSKAAGEREVRAGVERGLDAVIVAPTAVIGPHDFKPSRMGKLVVDVGNRRLPATVEGGFNWVDARDVVAGAMAAAARGRRGERYLLGGEYQSIHALACQVAECCGVRAPWFCSPSWMAMLGVPFASLYAAISGKEPLFNAASVDIVRHHALVSHEKAARELGYSPRPLRETIAQTVAWFREQGAIR
ncbi:MAG: NAD-dependent epimerase/dehydratase family protein [Myxococcales bacterium]|jgi:dihydroflavonol-4-reductase